MTAVSTRSDAPPGELASGALGLPSVLFCIVTGAAPLAAMMFNVPITVIGGGYASPAAFLVATVALTIFSVGYIEMGRRVTVDRRLLHVHQPRARAASPASAPGFSSRSATSSSPPPSRARSATSPPRSIDDLDRGHHPGVGLHAVRAGR